MALDKFNCGADHVSPNLLEHLRRALPNCLAKEVIIVTLPDGKTVEVGTAYNGSYTAYRNPSEGFRMFDTEEDLIQYLQQLA